jgi:gliding motility-associated-like protein
MTLSQTAYFSDNASIYVNVEGGNGTYIYQLDNGSFQSSNVFSNVTPGIHKVTVNDTNGCTDLSDTIYIVGYPKFFTPNGDGYNDTWNIVANESISFKSIRIFDRFGKFLYQINQNSAGWDGTYNGNMLSSSDYWFTFDYAIDGVDQIFKAHFTLKR